MIQYFEDMEIGRTLFGKQWNERENPEEILLSRAIEKTYNPNGPGRRSVLAVLKHPDFVRYHHICSRLWELTANDIVKASEFMDLSAEIDKLHDKIEGDIEKGRDFRPNSADFQTALSFKRKTNQG